MVQQHFGTLSLLLVETVVVMEMVNVLAVEMVMMGIWRRCRGWG